jgi:hypothetical protein
VILEALFTPFFSFTCQVSFGPALEGDSTAVAEKLAITCGSVWLLLT